IHYRRPPDRIQYLEQYLVLRTDAYTITYLPAADLERESLVDGRPILEPGSPMVWFTYPDRWHDIGRFYLKDGTFTGVYANILEPVDLVGDEWEMTDLFLDVWAGADGSIHLLDEDELAEAVTRGWLDNALADRSRREAERIMKAAARGDWPPPEVHEWTLERVLRELGPAGAPRSHGAGQAPGAENP